MRAVDTNIIVRLVTGDDPLQEIVARDLVARETMLVPLTVVLESEWVLRSFYRLTRWQIASALGRLASHPGLLFQGADELEWALSRYLVGADFGDMVHLLASKIAGAVSLVTFDAGMGVEAGPGGPVPVETPG